MDSFKRGDETLNQLMMKMPAGIYLLVIENENKSKKAMLVKWF